MPVKDVDNSGRPYCAFVRMALSLCCAILCNVRKQSTVFIFLSKCHRKAFLFRVSKILKTLLFSGYIWYPNNRT